MNGESRVGAASRGSRIALCSIAVGAIVILTVLGVVLTVSPAAPRASAPGRIVAFSAPAPCPVGSDPGVPAYNPVNHDLYVPDAQSGNITVVTSGCHAVASIALPSMAGPSAIVYDPADNYLYVTDSYYGSVYVLHNLRLIHTFPASKLDCPSAPAYDPVLGDVVIGSHCGSPQLVFLNGTLIVKHIGSSKIWTDPDPGVYDPASGRFLVAYTGGGNVTFYNPSSFAVLGHIAVGADPMAIAYDPANNLDYVASYSARTVTVFSSSGAGTSHGTIAVGSGPTSIAYSPKTLEVYVANSESANVSVINGTSLKAPIALSSFAMPDGLVYDPSNLKMYVADAQHAQIDKL